MDSSTALPVPDCSLPATFCQLDDGKSVGLSHSQYVAPVWLVGSDRFSPPVPPPCNWMLLMFGTAPATRVIVTAALVLTTLLVGLRMRILSKSG